ncbi:MAG: Na+/H+ antiporter subunit E [Clostridiales bacterium]|nr:Na+/H+ antiporter subunit E [Clostridiales bacterium]
MFFVFFLLWVIFNSRLTLEIAIFGIVFSGALYAFCCAFLDYSPKKDLAAVKRIPKMFRYVGLLLSEIVKSNVALIQIVLNRKIEVKPQLVKFTTPVTGPVAQNILADSITLTPGTITVLSEGNELTVHCLDERFMDGIDDTPFQQMLLTMQEEGMAHDA